MHHEVHTDLRRQLNTLNEPADLTFNLTESPWLRAGRKYSVRVRATFPFHKE